MKSIAILCNYRLDPNRVGGMDYFYWAFDAACREQGYKITWFFPNNAKHGNYPKLHIVDCKENRIEDFFLQYLKTESATYDYIICHFLEICTSFYRDVRNVTSAKIIAVDHNPRPLGGYTWRKQIRKRINGVRFGKYIDTYVGVSEYTRRELIKDFGNGIASRIQVVYNGIDVSRIRKRVVRNMRHPQFLVACHLRESKGIQDLIEAVSILPDLTKTHIHIDVYGDGPYRSILEEKTAAYGLQKQINFNGSSDKLFDIYANYDYLIHPTHMECFSLGLLESLAANVPVITTPVGGNEEAVKHGVNGFIFAAKNIQALSRLLMNVFEGKLSINEEVDEQIRIKFTIDMMVNNHLHLLD